jgi:putative ABC transport system permease protein
MLAEWTTDLRYAWRALLRTPGFLITSIGTLALAIGAVAGMFNVVNTVMLKPLPFPDADRLVVIAGTAPGSDLPERFNPGLDFFVQYKEKSRLIENVFVYGQGTSTLRTEDRVERIPMTWPSTEIWSTLGVRPLIGRLPVGDDSTVTLLSYQLWQSWFGGDTSVVGKSFFISGGMRQVIGIMPENFRFPSDNNLLYNHNPINTATVQPGQGGGPMIARLKPGVTREQLAAELTGLSKALPERFGGSPNYARIVAQHRALVDPLLERMVGEVATTSLWVLLGAVTIVLLIACANVANLFMVRAEGRQRDLAVRRAIGATRTQLVRLQMAEAFLVALVAGVLAVALTMVALPMFIRAAPEGIPRLSLVGLDVTTVLAAFVLVLVTALVCGAVPALRASSPDLMRLREGGRGSTGRRNWARNGLVVAQTALALVLLIGSALLVRSFKALSTVDAGYDTKDIYTFQYAPNQDQLRDGPSWGHLHLDMMNRLRALPGTQFVGVVNNIPLDEGTGGGRWLAGGQAEDGGGTLLSQNFAGGDYFQAMGIDVLGGRIFSTDEAVTPNTSVIISRSAADKMFPGQQAVGQQMFRRLQDTLRTFTVVGVVADVKQDDWREAGEAIVYFPLTGPTAAMWGMGSPAYVVKSPRAAALTREVRELVRQVAPEAPVYREFTMEFLAQRSMVQLTFTMLTLSVVSGLALILGAVGLYGVLAYVVAQRTREIGVRIALGATSGAVSRMVVSQGVRVVLVGTAIGIVAAFFSTRTMSTLLFGVKAADPVVFAGMSVLLIAIGVLASYLPARRASRVDPIESLRND